MKLNQLYSNFKISKNLEFIFVLILIIISIAITFIYNSSKNYSEKQYINLLNNLYFKKTANNFFNDLSPKYQKIEHIVQKNESINSIFKSNNLPDREINLILDSLKTNKIKNILKINQKILFTINKSNN